MQDPIPHEIHLTNYPATAKEATTKDNELLIPLGAAGFSVIAIIIFHSYIAIAISLLAILITAIYCLLPRKNTSYGIINGEYRKIELLPAEQEFQELGYQKVTVNGIGSDHLAVLASRPWSNRPGRREFVAFYQLEQATPNQQLIYRIDEEVQAKLH